MGYLQTGAYRVFPFWVRAFFAARGREGDIREFSVSSATVELAAVAAGCEAARIAKTLSFAVGDGCVLESAQWRNWNCRRREKPLRTGEVRYPVLADLRRFPKRNLRKTGEKNIMLLALRMPNLLQGG